MKKLKIILVVCLVIHFLDSEAQKPLVKSVSEIHFDKDSLSGFDEEAARKSAISEQFLGAEFQVRMYRLKREFINNKYYLNRVARTDGSNFLSLSRSVVNAACSNEDFESAAITSAITVSNQVSGWLLDAGVNNPYLPSSSGTAGYNPYFPNGLAGANSCNLMGCCPMSPSASAIIDCSATGGYIDFSIGSQYPIFSVFGTGTVSGATGANPQINAGLFGSKVLRLNNALNGDYSIEHLSKTFSVTSANALFQYAFITVLNPGHTCCDAGAFQVKVSSSTSVNIPCSSFSISAFGAQCTNSPSINFYCAGLGSTYDPNTWFNAIYNKWEVNCIDLRPYIGQTVTLDIIAMDCDAGGHPTYAYFDAQCGNMDLSINQNNYMLNDSILHFASCDSSVTMQAPSGFTYYQWAGPGGFSSANRTVNTTGVGIYTLTLGMGFSCPPLTQTISINLSSSTASITTSNPLICNGDGVLLTALGVNNCAWNTGNNTPSIYITPSVTTTYSVSGLDLNGCPASAVITQTVEDCTGISTVKTNSDPILVFPNPNNGEFTLKIGRELTKGEFLVETASGQTVHKQSVLKGENIIKTHGLVSGIYYYRVSDNKKTISSGKLRIE